MSDYEELVRQLRGLDARHILAFKAADAIEALIRDRNELAEELRQRHNHTEEAFARGYREGLEKAAGAARLAIVNNSDADELTCSICADAIRDLIPE